MVLECTCGGMVIECEAEYVCDKCGMVHETIPTYSGSWKYGVRRNSFSGRWRLYNLDRLIKSPNHKIHGKIDDICTKCGIPDMGRRRAKSYGSQS